MTTSDTQEEMTENGSTNAMEKWRQTIPVHVLAKIESFADAFQLATELAESVEQKVVFSDELGDGFIGLDRNGKRKLVGKRFIMISANFGHDEATGSDYVVCRVVTSDNEKYRFADGSTGIFDQIRAMVQLKGGFVPIMANHGLRASDYVTQVDGKSIQATTFYIDESVDD